MGSHDIAAAAWARQLMIKQKADDAAQRSAVRRGYAFRAEVKAKKLCAVRILTAIKAAA